jgi:hypothetical protein
MKRAIVLGLICTAAGACGKKSDTETASNNEGGSTQVGEVNISTDALATLNLSASLVPTVPDSVTASGQGVTPGSIAVATLVDRKKSREACLVRQRIKMARMDQEGIAAQLCYLEKVKGMAAGGKYKIKLTPPAPDMSGGPGGPTLTQGDMPPAGGGDMPPAGGGDMPAGGGDMPAGGPGNELELSVFLDNSDPAKFKVFMCDGDKLTQKIVIDGATAKGSKGSYVVKSTNEMGDIAIVGAFDNGVGKAGHQKATSQAAASFKMDNDTNKFRTNMYLDLVADGISEVKSAFEMSSTGSFDASMKELAAALIGPNLGAALFQHNGDSFFGGGGGGGDLPPPDGDIPPMPLTTADEVETSRAYFDSKGDILAKDDAEAFKEGGALEVKESMLPKLPPLDFDAKFDAGDWDCSGTTDIAGDVSEADFKACDAAFAAAFDDEDCDGKDFAPGAAAPDVPDLAGERVEFDPSQFGLPEGEVPPTGDVPPAE